MTGIDCRSDHTKLGEEAAGEGDACLRKDEHHQGQRQRRSSRRKPPKVGQRGVSVALTADNRDDGEGADGHQEYTAR